MTEQSPVFSNAQLQVVQDATQVCEEMVSDHYKMSSSQWLRSRYDIRTWEDLEPHERVTGPFAQVVGYLGRKKDAVLGSSSYDFYRICLQDPAILKTVVTKSGLDLFPFLLYIVVHELVHIVRFTRFQQAYGAASEAECAFQEECVVHGITREILKGVSIRGVPQVLEYYIDWGKSQLC